MFPTGMFPTGMFPAGMFPPGAAVEDDTITGGWLSEEQIRQIKKLLEPKKRRFELDDIERDHRINALREAYEQVTAGPEAEEIAAIVRPVAKSEAPIPSVASIDFEALANSKRILGQVIEKLSEIDKRRKRDSEDDDLLLLAAL